MNGCAVEVHTGLQSDATVNVETCERFEKQTWPLMVHLPK